MQRCHECWNLADYCTCHTVQIRVHPTWVETVTRTLDYYAATTLPGTPNPAYDGVPVGKWVIVADVEIEPGAARLINSGGDVQMPTWFVEVFPLFDDDARWSLHGEDMADVIEREARSWLDGE